MYFIFFRSNSSVNCLRTSREISAAKWVTLLIYNIKYIQNALQNVNLEVSHRQTTISNMKPHIIRCSQDTLTICVTGLRCALLASQFLQRQNYIILWPLFPYNNTLNFMQNHYSVKMPTNWLTDWLTSPIITSVRSLHITNSAFLSSSHTQSAPQ